MITTIVTFILGGLVGYVIGAQKTIAVRDGLVRAYLAVVRFFKSFKKSK
jgi:hypothetical protein